jgi:DNA polymerase-3 subunit epsilon/ATP-dependent DNA helicase DinG
LRPASAITPVDADFVASLLSEGTPLADAMPAFEERTEQVQMAVRVAETINNGGRLIVEAGTGVGKSMAYLLPAILYAVRNNKRVVVSTNTINLQEQLMTKDVPALVDALESVGGIPAGDFRATVLKGRANYLCMRRFQHMRAAETLTDHEARMIAKMMVWLRDTETGDRSELNLGNRASSAPWDRLSAQGAVECLSQGGPCFLRAARERAAAAHLVIVNHALLLSDVSANGALIPEYDLLIIDEAHHLEDEATRHLGFELAQARFDDHLNALSGERGLLRECAASFRGSTAPSAKREATETVSNEIADLLPRTRDHIAALFAPLSQAAAQAGKGDNGNDVRVTSAVRAQPAWSDLEAQWENADIMLAELGTGIRRLDNAMNGLEDANMLNYDGIVMELSNVQNVNTELRARLREFTVEPKDDGIYWVSRQRNGELSLNAAPLHVGEALESLLFSQKESVVMTSATLSTDGSFKHICDRTGFADADELMLGSPFDYPKAAMLCVPEDMPEPNSWAYQAALSEAVSEAALAAGGRTMALFTSHASLQATAAEIRANLEARGISVLAQGIDGSPGQLVARFLENPESVLLGTASFWEGVDLAGDSLQVLLVARLPFSVPSEPVFEARSEHYEDAFNGYSVPQAILRLRQGFGRLIRTRTDRGVAIILDKRIVSRRYGKAFIRSLPPGTFKKCSVLELESSIKEWLGK